MSIPISDIALNVFKIMQRLQLVSLITPTVTGTDSQTVWREVRGQTGDTNGQILPCVVSGGFAPSAVQSTYIIHLSQKSEVKSWS